MNDMQEQCPWEGQSQCCGHSGVGHRELGEVLERGQRHLQIHFRDG